MGASFTAPPIKVLAGSHRRSKRHALTLGWWGSWSGGAPAVLVRGPGAFSACRAGRVSWGGPLRARFRLSQLRDTLPQADQCSHHPLGSPLQDRIRLSLLHLLLGSHPCAGRRLPSC